MNYGHFGKEYAGEKAIISLTSWKARISTVGLTIFNLKQKCPGFHIVLVLSEDEFPNKEGELPQQLVCMANANLFEIIWVKKNYRAFKKILFTMDKYRTVPIISADDDCLYRRNYAAELYQVWKTHPRTRVCYWCAHIENRIYNTSGYATIHPPFFYKNAVEYLTDDIINMHEDDLFYAAICKLLGNTGCICLNKTYEEIVLSHDEAEPLHDKYRNAEPSKERFRKMYNTLKTMVEKEVKHEHHRQ